MALIVLVLAALAGGYYILGIGKNLWSAPQDTTFRVQADQSWQHTGVSVQEGDTISIEYVFGRWSPFPGYSTDGRGCISSRVCTDDLNSTANICCTTHASLIAQIGDYSPVAIGNGDVFHAPGSGPLYLSINDRHRDDNAGGLIVRIATGSAATSSNAQLQPAGPQYIEVPSSDQLGKGDILRGPGLSIELTDYEFRPFDHPEAAAVRYTLSFKNETNAHVSSEIKGDDISATDNQGVAYRDYFAILNSYWKQNCTGEPTDFETFSSTYIDISANSSKAIHLYLSKSGTTGDCNKWGLAETSRVDSDVNYIRVTLPAVRYIADQLYEFSATQWILVR